MPRETLWNVSVAVQGLCITKRGPEAETANPDAGADQKTTIAAKALALLIRHRHVITSVIWFKKNFLKVQFNIKIEGLRTSIWVF